MVLLGVDPHNDTHTVVARTLGHAELLGWARHHWPGERVWAVEDCRHVTSSIPTSNPPLDACPAHPWTRSPPGWPGPHRRSRSPSARS
jgi:hypothetical protein